MKTSEILIALSAARKQARLQLWPGLCPSAYVVTEINGHAVRLIVEAVPSCAGLDRKRVTWMMNGYPIKFTELLKRLEPEEGK